ncbi:DNA-binding transcriptional regulator, AcrR family [Asanoa hainanensis]|uniref:DNA-binding transcriptional regulator, AcrR family n=1 Tax=Asanoa hainanensis TaxID=560556 RepID=A0A239M0K7_9ACTN|nr:TetR/AcrR family transcriptional regulator [Asanoa hainanensis]SNT36211.1 DNA-binding transcriptional regulator, AcrR family [Asanoa hainanensis]
MDEKQRVIIDQAIAIADESGIEAVSMRAVGQRLGLSPMAIYPYLRSKGALLDGMVERMLGELLAAAPGTGDWQDRLRAVSAAVRTLARRHPGAYPLIVARPGATAESRRLDDLISEILLAAGVPAAEVPRLERLLSTLLLGFANSEVNGRFGAGPPDGDWDSEFAADLDDEIRLIEQIIARSGAA